MRYTISPDAIIVEMFELATGKVIASQEIKDLDSFKFYWKHQCDSVNYDWSIKQ